MFIANCSLFIVNCSLLIALDASLFLFLNGLHAPYWDTFMYTFSQMEVWIPFYAALLWLMVRTWRKESGWVILAVVLCVVLADQVSSGLIKEWVQRPRPTHTAGLQELVHTVNGYRGGRYGFVSSHAANTFGLALFCTLLFRNRWYAWTMFLWALVTSYSRIYLGVHFPGDILGGTLVGLGAAWLCYWLLRRFRPQAVQRSGIQQTWLLYLPLGVLAVTVLVIAVYSAF